MEKIVITIHPPGNDTETVLALEALEQGSDVLRLLEAAGRARALEGSEIEWRLDKATTNSPLTLEVSVGESATLADVDSFTISALDGLTASLREISEYGTLPPWLHEELQPVARRLFSRANGSLGVLEIGNGNGKRYTVDQPAAERALAVLDHSPPVSVERAQNERALWGEVKGSIVSVATWYGKPAIRIVSRQLSRSIPCIVTPDIIERYGSQHSMSDVWAHQLIAVRGQLIYRDGLIVRIVAEDVRDVAATSRVDIEFLRDPDFTGGLDPVEYLRRFHEGELIA